MQVIGILLTLALGILQFFAIISGISLWFGVPTIVAVILSFILAAIPLLGTVLGMFGAMQAWGWAWWQAGLLFFGLFALSTILGGMAGIISAVSQRRRA